MLRLQDADTTAAAENELGRTDAQAGLRRVALIGTAATLPALAGWLRGSGSSRPVTCVGHVRVESGTRSGAPLAGLECGAEELGRGVDDAQQTIAALLARNVDLVVVLGGPEEGKARRLIEALHRHGVASVHLPSLDDALGIAEARETGAAVTSGASARNADGWTGPVRVNYAELIGRTPYDIDRLAVGKLLGGKRVLITGAGGSIGSELARTTATFAPELIVLMDRSENALFEIDRQIGGRFPRVPRHAVMHDVVNERETMELLARFRPDVVLHAAAHKHVPLMEDHPAHALENNLFGTKAITDACMACGVGRFVMISSDKAVNPRSVMGATKRLAEMYVSGTAQRMHGSGREGCRASMVRFGNVLGSSCSVLTIWSSQLAEGGPITVTDPRMTRYFMTIPEAAGLVIQSMALGADGESPGRDCGPTAHRAGAPVYVLDMGEPVRVLDLALRFVRAHGLRGRVRGGAEVRSALAALVGAEWAGSVFEDRAATDGVDGESLEAGLVDIVLTGARPGEKIHEELAYAAEMLSSTAHPGIRGWSGCDAAGALEVDTDTMVSELSEWRSSRDHAGVSAAIKRWVPTLGRTAI